MGYTSFDRFVARQRFSVAYPYIKQSSRVCDVGCGLNASFLESIKQRTSFSVGVDYQFAGHQGKKIHIVCCDITQGIPLQSSFFDCAVMLAVLEHLEQPIPVFLEIFRILAPGGSLVMTWPQKVIDPYLNLLHKIGFISREMESDKHQPRIAVESLVSILTTVGFTNFVHSKFELGLNNLLVCSKS